VPYGNAQAAADAISPEVGAIIVEPVQSESGAVVPPRSYLKDLSGICTGSGTLLILDEIKTGMGKTGNMFACELDQVEPDVLLVGKSLGGGVMPIGAMIAKRKWWTKFGLSFAMSSSSSAGNRIACSAGVATLEVIKSENLCVNADRQGRRLRRALVDLCCLHPELLRTVSGRGLLVGLHTTSQKIAYEIITRCMRQGVLMMTAFLDRSRILIEPPLCVDDTQIDEIVMVLQQACQSVAALTL
jgi:putrescine aminotransferase